MDELRAAMNEAWDKAEAAAREEEVEDAVEEDDASLNVEEDSHETNETEVSNYDDKQELAKEPAKLDRAAPEKTEANKVVEKAPASWTPKARETWAKLPPEARAEVAKREAEINTALKQSAAARQGMQELNRVMEPYRASLIAAGVQNPFQAIDTLFRTESTLRHGNNYEKAKTIANLISQYGVDIRSLDDILAGQPAKAQGGNSELEALLEQRLAPVNQFLQQQQRAQQQAEFQSQQSATASVAKFSEKAEFINEVRMDMADLLDMAAARGQQMSLEDAYNKACALNPEISKVLADRAKQQQIMGTKSQMAAKRHAASSIAGTRGGDGGGGGDMSLRDAIAEAWNERSG